MHISVEELLAPLSGESPCGEDLSYDPALSDLETRVQGKAETQFAAAEEPNWRDVQKLCLDLFTRTKDLRVTMALALALLRLDGLPGFAQGTELLRGLLEQYWPGFYPRLDPEDDNDPLERMNLLSSLAAPEGTFGDAMRFIARLREVPLCQSAVAGSFSLAQMIAATSPPSGAASAGPDLAVIQAAFRDTPVEFLEQQFRAAESALASVEAVGAFLTATVGVGNAANLDPLAAVLRDIRARLGGNRTCPPPRPGPGPTRQPPRRRAARGGPSAPGTISAPART